MRLAYVFWIFALLLLIHIVWPCVRRNKPEAWGSVFRTLLWFAIAVCFGWLWFGAPIKG